MKHEGARTWSLWRDRGGVREISRRAFLAVYILFVIITGLFVFLLPSAHTDDFRVLLAASAFLLSLMPLAWVRVRGLYTTLMHLIALTALGMVLYMAAHSGGINSSVMVWLNILAVPVLMLRGPRVALLWIGLVELSTLGMMLLTQRGWIDGHAHITADDVPWALANNVLALVELMSAVVLYHHLHALQMKELNLRTRELKSTHQKLLQAQAHKDEFVAAVGHELRTPMNSILGFNGVLQEELSDRPDELRVVEHIRRSTEHLLQVINEILDFSQLQAGKVQLLPEDFDLHAALLDLKAQYEPLAHDKGLAFQMQGLEQLPQHVHMDRQRLRQIMALLLNNAIKFTAVGHVDMTLSQHGPRLRCEVSDTGCGIAPDRLAHIFRYFEHADVQTNRTHGGTGLGLSICEHLVKLHGGEIGVHSLLNQGTVFWFEVPWRLALTCSTPSEQQGLPSHPAAPVRVLVVDDNAVNLKVAELQIRKVWPQSLVVTAQGAHPALQLLAQEPFDVALVDMVMPQMDGPALTQEIHQRLPSVAARMPIIALTANTQQQEHQRCLSAGMSAVLYKPIDPQELARTVTQQLQRHWERT